MRPRKLWEKRKRTGHARRKPWRYLSNGRSLADVVFHATKRQDVLREGPRGGMWAPLSMTVVS
ncbi:hypothetical protein [Ensifer sp. MJa1]|uniref:hypothetical protein n=1 Tax=Ensifer sp. MJa1 TaxID=2919888 RepID=UPI00300A1F45